MVTASDTQIDVGLIPNEWKVVCLGALGTFSKGQGIRKDQANSGDIPCVRYGELYTVHNEIIRDFPSRISNALAKTSKKICSGDILFAGSGETKAEIGKCAAFIGDVDTYAGGDIIVFSPRKADSRLLGYILNTAAVAAQKASKGQGDAVVHISANALSSLLFAFPSEHSEQKAIAAALADADALIASLDALIAKKRDLKKAAMQQLLTGKTRLPGFTGDWEVKRLGEVLKVRHGKSQKGVEARNGLYPILATGGEIGRTNSFLYDKPSVLIGRKGTIDAPQFIETPFWTIDTLFFTEILEGIVAQFVFYVFVSIDWRSFNEASGVPSLNSATIEKIEIACPKTDEQVAIAKVLSDMDADIAVLEAKRDKAHAIKQGMMQELLTGRTRLV